MTELDRDQLLGAELQEIQRLLAAPTSQEVEPEDVELLAVCVEVERDRSAFPTCSSGAGKKTLQLGTVRVQGIEAEGDQALEAVQLASAVRRRALSERWRAKSARGQLIRGEQADPAFPPGGIPDRVGVWRLEGDEG